MCKRERERVLCYGKSRKTSQRGGGRECVILKRDTASQIKSVCVCVREREREGEKRIIEN